ncbi:MAG: 23S rRNA (guanosine(2251)-2'-O)-methyltransferase RlmB [Bacteroidetes bacterium]|nr:23S rRNA (guanosine(2251)-2'-O)-methyltransferase RlmB [Bacteroidota bacterium]
MYRDRGPQRGGRPQGRPPRKQLEPLSKDLLFGFHAVEEALNAGKDIDRVLYRQGLRTPQAEELRARLRQNGVNIQQVPVEKLDTISRGKNHNGVIAYAAAVSYQKVEDIVPFLFEEGKTPLLILLDGVTDVRNIGGIARTAECLGAHAIILPRQGAARLGADAVQASAGALHHLPVCRVEDPVATAEYLQSCGISLVAATEKAWKTPEQVDFTAPLCLIMGAEDVGIRPELLALSQEQVSIALSGRIGSLNVGAATAILLHVADLQRKHAE